MSNQFNPSEDGLQILEKVDFSDDEDDFKYEEIELDNNDEEEDDLAEALAVLQTKKNISSHDNAVPITQVRPSVVDDFVRNFLIKADLKRTLDCFNTEWYEMQSKGKLPPELSSAVPDIYLRNEELDTQTKVLREQVNKMREVAERAQATWDKFRRNAISIACIISECFKKKIN